MTHHYVVLTSHQDYDSPDVIGPFDSQMAAEDWVGVDGYRSGIERWWENRLGSDPAILIIGPGKVDYTPEQWMWEYEADEVTIDEAILSHECPTCHAPVGNHCTIRGVHAAEVKDALDGPEHQQFYYHAKRTDAGCRTWNIGRSNMSSEEKQALLAR